MNKKQFDMIYYAKRHASNISKPSKKENEREDWEIPALIIAGCILVICVILHFH